MFRVPNAAGTFEITSTPEPPLSTDDGILIGRMTFEKVFSGGLEGTSTVHMTYARTPVETSAGYVAVERVIGSLGGREGSFVVLHTGLSTGDAQSLALTIVPDSGTHALQGIAGSMTIEVVDGIHEYTVDYALPES
ncbi:MAG: DUF3224 domain-containing protein [Actinobacteria bacterium]|nr:DUF3224 domain-containing protein [Thermoleophilia bacterium]MCB9010531.1 DUF3224 domain-containing protein [Actinomycetota bacterium]